jgi:aminomethyltransferase
MISVQGPRSPEVLEAARGEALPPEVRASRRNTVWNLAFRGTPALTVRTGYAGEPLGFELMLPSGGAGAVWDSLLAAGALAVGLGARDTLRLEAGLPLYGHELGTDQEGREIPAMACPQARLSVRSAARKAAVRGRDAFGRQAEAWRRIRAGDPRDVAALPRLVRQLTLLEPGVARAGAALFDAAGDRRIGWVTSGTVIPAWEFQGTGAQARITERHGKRSALLGLVDSTVSVGAPVRVQVRGKLLRAALVPRLLDSGTPPYALPVPPGRESDD